MIAGFNAVVEESCEVIQLFFFCFFSIVVVVGGVLSIV
jgi:hypothetical protein